MKRYLSFYELLSSQDSSSISLIYEENGEKVFLSYKELIKLIDEYPLSNKSSIGILCANNIETIVSIFAYAKAKRQMVLLNSSDNLDILVRQIEAGDVSYLVGDSKLCFALKDRLCFDKAIPNNGNILFFTSGTTSSNKAVVLTEESLCASAYNGSSLLPLDKKDILLSILPLSHVFGFVCSLLWGLSNGSSVALTRGMRHLFDDGAYFKATVISLVPQIASFIAINNLVHKELKLVLIGAAACSKEVADKLNRLGVRVSLGYGLTETSSGVALSLRKDIDIMNVCPLSKISIAKDNEILISMDSPCLMKGYYKDDESTSKVLYDNYLHTGDLGMIDEYGFLHLLGRKKDILLLDDGTKIYLPEYEKELLSIFSNEDLAVNLFDKKIVLFIHPESLDIDISKGVKEFNLNKPLNQRIVKIVKCDNALPRTQTGKIKRYELGKLL